VADLSHKAAQVEKQGGASSTKTTEESNPSGLIHVESPKVGLRTKFRRWFRRLFVDPLVYSSCPPWYDARAVSLGLITGFMVPIGGQLLTLAALRVLIRFNFIVAAAFTLVSNPLDMAPLYYGYYCLGSVILGRSTALDYVVFEKLMNPVLDKSYFWEAFAAFMELSHEILVRWIVAAAALAFVFGAIGYIVTFKVQKNRCKRAAERLGEKYEEYVEELEIKARLRKV
jgi:uncharacterized protein (DUF2062 family)